MSKYKVGDKDVMKIISADQDEIKTYSVSGVNNDWRWCLPQNLLERYIEPLSTYTEPLEAKIRRQAAEITRLQKGNAEIVRCKDCKHATFYNCKNDACYKRIICEYEIGTDDENFYCAYGEARTPKERDGR